ncbi:MAG: hypothetical protein IPI40_02915 [Betaproteobacteria bacterium]|nr:hypothetical protein [Betaproteobacteria bacterium]
MARLIGLPSVLGAGPVLRGSPGAAHRGHWIAFALRAPVFALGAAHRGHWIAFALRAPVFALGAAHRAH